MVCKRHDQLVGFCLIDGEVNGSEHYQSSDFNRSGVYILRQHTINILVGVLVSAKQLKDTIVSPLQGN